MTDEARPGTMRKVGKGCLVIIGFFFLLAVVGALFGGDEDGESIEAVNSGSGDAAAEPAALAVNARELAAAYDANEVAAQSYYGDQLLAVTGTVTGVTLDFMDNPVVQLAGVNEFLPVQAKLEDKEAAAALRKGATVTLMCDDVTEVISAPVLSGCVIAP